MKSETTVLEVGGLHWATSEPVVEKTLARRPGVLAVEANASSQTATITYDPDRTSVAQFAGWVTECGYHCAGQSVPDHVCDPMSEPATTHTGNTVNGLSAESLAEVGVDISGNTSKPVTEEMVRAADVVVALGREAHVDEVPGTRFENWDTDEPPERGIEGIERMRLVRDDIARRVDDLYNRLTTPT